MKKLKIVVVLIPLAAMILSALLFSKNKMFCAMMIFGDACIILAKAYAFYADRYSTSEEEKFDYHLGELLRNDTQVVPYAKTLKNTRLSLDYSGMSPTPLRIRRGL